MRTFQQNWTLSPIAGALQNATRRWRWFVQDATRQQLANMARSGIGFVLRRRWSGSVPVLIKLDISPMCNLSCSFCVHSAADDVVLDEQVFSSAHRVDLAAFEKLIAEIRHRTSVLALYYVGDPLVHPDLDAMCTMAGDARIRTHVSTNFSFRLSDERLRSLIESGLSHLTVCVDSMVQEEYDKTRVGGDIELVLSNLERLLAIRSEGRSRLHVEVQYIKFRHNVHNEAVAEQWCRRHGVDQFTSYWGNLHNYVDLAPERVEVVAPRGRSWLPRCAWPYFAMTVRYDGATLPCCYHRVSEQYRTGGDDRPVGNVFTDGVEEVWTGPAYGRLRELVDNPAGLADAERNASFCSGCGVVEDTTSADRVRRADAHEWEPVRLGRPPA